MLVFCLGPAMEVIMVTIKEVAREAGVSIATVSHVLNKTRYVNQSTTEKVFNAIQKLGYSPLKIYPTRKKQISLWIPYALVKLYTQFSYSCTQVFEIAGYRIQIIYYNTIAELLEQKEHISSAYLIIPYGNEEEIRKFAKSFTQPFLFLWNEYFFIEDCTYVGPDYTEAAYLAVSTLLSYGHENPILFLDSRESNLAVNYQKGYQKAFDTFHYQCNNNIININPTNLVDYEWLKRILLSTTAVVCSSFEVSYYILRYINRFGIRIFEDISLIFLNNNLCNSIFNPSITSVTLMEEAISKRALVEIQKQFSGKKEGKICAHLPVELILRDSTQMITNGPFGDRAFPSKALVLTPEETDAIALKKSKVGIVFNCSGNMWMRSYETGIRAGLEQMKIQYIETASAQLDHLEQRQQLENVLMQEPDIVINAPVFNARRDEYLSLFQKKTKVIFISDLPNNIRREDYYTYIVPNNEMIGYECARLFGEYFKDEHAEIASISHRSLMIADHHRNFSFRRTIFQDYKNLDLVVDRQFNYSFESNEVYEICQDIVRRYPRIKGLYITWAHPACDAIRALEDMGRDDIKVVTADLEYQVAQYMAKGKYVIGVSSQKPYEQGLTVAKAVACALLGKTIPSLIAVPPIRVTRENLAEAWRIVHHIDLPYYIQKELNFH